MNTKKALSVLIDARSYIVEHCDVPGENALVIAELQEMIDFLETDRVPQEEAETVFA
jgi:hypothetical protein